MNKYKRDTESIDNVLETIYDVLSGEEGEKRDWERQRNLFYPGAGFTIVKKDSNTNLSPQFVSLEDYAKEFEESFKNPSFYEVQVKAITEHYGNIAHVFSTYFSYYSKEDKTPFKQGINSVQLYHDGERWWVMNVYWDRDGVLPEMPERYSPDHE